MECTKCKVEMIRTGNRDECPVCKKNWRVFRDVKQYPDDEVTK